MNLALRIKKKMLDKEFLEELVSHVETSRQVIKNKVRVLKDNKCKLIKQHFEMKEAGFDSVHPQIEMDKLKGEQGDATVMIRKLRKLINIC